MLKISPMENAETFLDATAEDLLRQEAELSLLFGVALRVREGHRYSDEPAFFLTVHDADHLVAAVVQTPPHGIILHCHPDRHEALASVSAFLLDNERTFPSVHSTAPAAERFCHLWHQQTGQSFELRMAQRLYQLTDVQPTPAVSGSMRWATEADVTPLARWWMAFIEEATHDGPPPDAEASVRRFLRAGRLALWEDGAPVSMVGSGRGTPNGRTIAPVYTPRELRCKGYATACVAALCRQLLAEGNRFCTLYTDLSNPTSNRIYQGIGFRPLSDWAMYTVKDREA